MRNHRQDEEQSLETRKLFSPMSSREYSYRQLVLETDMYYGQLPT